MGRKSLGKKWHGTTTCGDVQSTTLRYAGILSNNNFYTISYVPATMLNEKTSNFCANELLRKPPICYVSYMEKMAQI